MTEIPEMIPIDSCVLVMISLKLVLLFCPYGVFLSILGRGVMAEPIIIVSVCHMFAVDQAPCRITLKIISSH